MALSVWDWLIIDGYLTVKDYVLIAVVIPIIIMVGLVVISWLYNVVYYTDWRRIFRRKRK